MPSIKLAKLQARDSARILRIALGALLVLNLGAAALVLYPPGGTAEGLEQQTASLQSQLIQKRALVERTRKYASSVEKGRTDGDGFLTEYFLPRRSAFTTLLSELGEAARNAHVQERENAWETQPVEGSDALSMMTITANYEGTYRDLMNFVREIDQSQRLVIIESLNAAPQTGSNLLTVAMKLEAFVREDNGQIVVPPATSEAPPSNPVAELHPPGAKR